MVSRTTVYMWQRISLYSPQHWAHGKVCVCGGGGGLIVLSKNCVSVCACVSVHVCMSCVYVCACVCMCASYVYFVSVYMFRTDVLYVAR